MHIDFSELCFRLYHKIFKRVYKSASGEQLVHELKAAAESYNTEDNQTAAMSVVDGHVAIAICTPLMKRVHQMHRTSGEMVFVDATGGLDRHDCQVFLLMTHSAVGE